MTVLTIIVKTALMLFLTISISIAVMFLMWLASKYVNYYFTKQNKNRKD